MSRCQVSDAAPGGSAPLRAFAHISMSLLPLAFLQRLVDQDNHKFEEWCSEMADMRKQSVDKGKAKHEEVKELYELLPARDGR